MSALSDSISTRISPFLIFSPSFRSHFRMTPSSMVSLSFGIMILVAMRIGQSVLVKDRLEGAFDFVIVGQGCFLQRFRVRQGYVFLRHALHRCVEIIEGALGQFIGNLAAYAGEWPSLFNNDQPGWLLYRRADEIIIHRLDGPRINDFNGGAQFLLELFNGGEDDTGKDFRPRDECHVGTFPLYFSLTEGNRVLSIGNFFLIPVHHFTFYKDDRVFLPDCTLEQSFCISAIRRHHNLEAGYMSVQRLQCL